MKSVKPLDKYQKLLRKHPIISLFLSIEALSLLDYIHSTVSYRAFGYMPVTEFTEKMLPFWHNCGYFRISEISYPNLYCMQDTNTYINPLLRALLWGAEASAVISAFVLGTILLACAVGFVVQRRINFDTQYAMKFAIQFVGLVAFLWLRYSI